MTDTAYTEDLTAEESLITLEEADSLLGASLYGVEWTSLSEIDRKAALRDASDLISLQPWKGRKTSAEQPQAFPRTGLSDAEGTPIPSNATPLQARRATALLAVHLASKRDQSMSPELFRAYQIGEVRGEFRAPVRDDLPRHVRQLLAPFLIGSTTWSPVTP